MLHMKKLRLKEMQCALLEVTELQVERGSCTQVSVQSPKSCPLLSTWCLLKPWAVGLEEQEELSLHSRSSWLLGRPEGECVACWGCGELEWIGSIEGLVWRG